MPGLRREEVALLAGISVESLGAFSSALLASPRPRLAAMFVSLAAASLVATGIWALVDTRLAGGLFYFPNNEIDALLHFGTAMIFVAGAAHYFAIERKRPG